MVGPKFDTCLTPQVLNRFSDDFQLVRVHGAGYCEWNDSVVPFLSQPKVFPRGSLKEFLFDLVQHGIVVGNTIGKTHFIETLVWYPSARSAICLYSLILRMFPKQGDAPVVVLVMPTVAKIE